MASAPLAGALAGLVEVIMVQPLDMVKTRFQIHDKGRNPSVPRALLDVYREGGIGRFYRGFLPEAASTMPARTAMYSTYFWVNERLSREWGGPSATAATIGGFCSGVPEGFVANPLQVVKVRLQSKEYLGQYRNTFDCFGKILRTEGVMALMAGVEATCYRNILWNGPYFGLVFEFKRRMERGNESVLMRAFGTSGISLIAGALATCVNAPMDTAKSRIQMQDVRLDVKKYRHAFQTLGLILKEEGLRSCYKGFAPKALRMAFGGAIGMPIFEAVNAALSKTGSVASVAYQPSPSII
jgi:solute carrier family 25 2-oxodicarboxylate transporter 21